MNEVNTLYEFYLQNQNIICLSRGNRALVAKTNYCIFVLIFGMFMRKNLYNSKKSSNFAPALEGVAEIILQPSISTTYHNGIQSYAPETAGTPERGV